MPVRRIQRPQLIRKLNEGLELKRRITLVSAPAGFGKTTCISEWVSTLDHWSAGWLSLDPADDDPVRFFAYLIAALQKNKSKLGYELEGALRTGQLPSAEIIATTLINAISDLENQFLLVLDDFHVVQDRLILQVFELLLANPPESIHLVIITREDPPLPLAQLRAKNQLTEIRASDLRFDIPDAARFFSDVMGLSLLPTDIEILEDKTEGWIAGLQLAGLSIQNQENASDFIISLNGRHRYILGYLTEQVLDRQTKDIQKFLLQTSILSKLNGDLCNAVTGRTDSHVLLEKIFSANLFLISLDDEGLWYRYHHLFADLLRNLQKTLQEDEITCLHKRASEWYAKAGMASDAIEHALSAKDFPLAVNLLERYATGMIMLGHAKTVHRWVQALPEEWEARRPRTNLAFAWAYLLRGAYYEVSEYLGRTEKALTKNTQRVKDKSIWAEWLVIQSLKAYMQGEITECMDMANRGLGLVPERDSRVRSLAYFVKASGYQQMKEYSQAIEAYRMSIKLGQAAKNLVAEMMSTVGLAGMLLEHGQLHLAYEIASQAARRIERSGSPPPISAVVYASIGDAHYQWDQLEEAKRYFQRALHLSLLGGSNTVTIFCHMLLSRLSRIEGDLETADREIQTAADLIPAKAPEYIRQEVFAQLVQIHLARNRLAAAEAALQGQGFSFEGQSSYPDLTTGVIITYATGQLYNSYLRILLYKARTKRDPSYMKGAMGLADRLITRISDSEQYLILLEALLLRAQAHSALGDSRSSQADYIHALELGEPEGFIGIFVEGGPHVGAALEDLSKKGQLGTIQPDYVRRLLSAFTRLKSAHDQQPTPDRSTIQSPQSLIEPMTERELEVLRLIAEGLKYMEIAARLFISQNTVRFHVKAIYSKLNVNNRTQAIETARQIHLL